jgi:hypothetical protein
MRPARTRYRRMSMSECIVQNRLMDRGTAFPGGPRRKRGHS